VYETGVMESFAADFQGVLKETEESEVRWVVVFSPTGCEAMLRVLGWLDENTGRAKSHCQKGEGGRRTFVATIGPTTRDFLEKEFGFKADVCAETPSPEGVSRGIEKYMGERGIR